MGPTRAAQNFLKDVLAGLFWFAVALVGIRYWVFRQMQMTAVSDLVWATALNYLAGAIGADTPTGLMFRTIQPRRHYFKAGSIGDHEPSLKVKARWTLEPDTCGRQLDRNTCR
jgi:hypothetical protein